ncbi:MAG TPA: dipeptidase PepE [Thermoanaerobaculia bacterium]|nr:dipeptidase PepE [Thermoanaerobaculia bacterium]
MHLLLISSSNVHGYGYLDHAEPDIKSFLGSGRKAGFVPFALRDREGYTAKVRERLGLMGYEVSQIQGKSDLDGIDAIFVGGGNTWRLLDELYERKMLDAIRDRVRKGLPYIGSSAGTNIAAPTIKTTNDMPIVQPPSFDALGLVPFQINPHYLDPEPDSKHKGETREERIREFLEENTTPVVGLREGTMLRVTDGKTLLVGLRPARIFRRGQDPVEVEPGNVIPGL